MEQDITAIREAEEERVRRKEAEDAEAARQGADEIARQK